MVEQTLVIIKPDGVMKNVVEQIKQKYVDVGLSIIREIKMTLKESEASDFYMEHAGMFYFEGLILSMVSGPCVVLILEGEQAIKTVRTLNGPTNPAKAKPGTIRYDFPSAGGPFNTVHGSDSSDSAKREIQIMDHARRKREL